MNVRHLRTLLWTLSTLLFGAAILAAASNLAGFLRPETVHPDKIADVANTVYEPDPEADLAAFEEEYAPIWRSRWGERKKAEATPVVRRDPPKESVASVFKRTVTIEMANLNRIRLKLPTGKAWVWSQDGKTWVEDAAGKRIFEFQGKPVDLVRICEVDGLGKEIEGGLGKNWRATFRVDGEGVSLDLITDASAPSPSGGDPADPRAFGVPEGIPEHETVPDESGGSFVDPDGDGMSYESRPEQLAPGSFIVAEKEWDAINENFEGYLSEIKVMAIPQDGSLKGVKLTDVPRKSMAYRYGFREGDIVKRVMGVEISDLDEIRDIVEQSPEADRVVVEVMRNGRVQPLTFETQGR